MQKTMITLTLMTFGFSATVPAYASSEQNDVLTQHELHVAIADTLAQNMQTLEAPAISQQIAAALKQSTLQHEIDQRLDLARQTLPRNQFKVIIGE